MIDRTIPLVELHRHLEGSVRLGTVIELSMQHGLHLPTSDLEQLKTFAYLLEPTADMIDILPRFGLFTQVFTNYEACKRITRECLEDAMQEGVDYVELRFSPLFMAETHGLDPMSVTSAVCDAWQEASTILPIQSKLIVIMSRTYGPEACKIELEAALANRDRGIAAVDLAGDEARFPASLFERHFRRAKDAGLRLIAHAGEFRGHESVREAVEVLKVERLGHAVHAADDEATMDLLLERNVAVECCPTSNYYTCAVSSLETHPLPQFLAHGVCATINTDDPSLFRNIRLEDEYGLAAARMGLGAAELLQIQANGLKAAFLEQSEVDELKKRVADRIKGIIAT